MQRPWLVIAAISSVLYAIVRGSVAYLFAQSILFVPLPGAHDRTLYHEAAIAVANGQLWPETAFAFLPLYPWLLGLAYMVFGTSLLIPLVLGMLMDWSTLMLIILVARRLGAPPWSTLIVAVLFICYPVAVVYAPLTMPNSLNMLLVTGWTWWAVRMNPVKGRDWLILGGSAGVIALGFAGALLLMLVVGTVIAWSQRQEKKAWFGWAMAWLAFAIPLAPVSWHNTRAEGAFVLLTTHGGFNFYMGNHERATGHPVRVRDFRMTAQAMLADAHAAAEAAKGRSLSGAESSSWWMQQGRDFWRTEPWSAIALTGRKIMLFWHWRDVDDMRMAEQLRIVEPRLHWLIWPGFALIAIGGVVGLISLRGGGIPGVVVLTGMVSLVMFFITARYRLTFVPLMLALAAAGTVQWPVWWKRRSWRAWAPLPLILLILWPLDLRDLRPFDYHNVAVQVLAEGQAAWGLHLVEQGLEIDPQSLELHHARGHALALMERHEEAAESFAFVLQRNPRNASAAFNLGLVLARAGQFCEALEALAFGLQHTPNDARLNQLYGDLSPWCDARD